MSTPDSVDPTKVPASSWTVGPAARAAGLAAAAKPAALARRRRGECNILKGFLKGRREHKVYHLKSPRFYVPENETTRMTFQDH